MQHTPVETSSFIHFGSESKDGPNASMTGLKVVELAAIFTRVCGVLYLEIIIIIDL